MIEEYQQVNKEKGNVRQLSTTLAKKLLVSEKTDDGKKNRGKGRSDRKRGSG